MTSERGFALIAVLLVLALLAVVVTEFAFSARLEASMVRAYRDGVQARHLAEAGVQQAIREILSQSQVAALDEDGQLVFYRALPGQTTPLRLPALPRTRVGLGPGEFSYRISDEAARISVNGAGPERLERLLAALEVERAAARHHQGLAPGLAGHQRAPPRPRGRERLLSPAARSLPLAQRQSPGRVRAAPDPRASPGSSTSAWTAVRGSAIWSPRSALPP